MTIVEFFIFFQNEETKCNQNHKNYLKYTKCQYLTGPNIKIQQYETQNSSAGKIRCMLMLYACHAPKVASRRAKLDHY